MSGSFPYLISRISLSLSLISDFALITSALLLSIFLRLVDSGTHNFCALNYFFRALPASVQCSLVVLLFVTGQVSCCSGSFVPLQLVDAQSTTYQLTAGPFLPLLFSPDWIEKFIGFLFQFFILLFFFNFVLFLFLREKAVLILLTIQSTTLNRRERSEL